MYTEQQMKDYGIACIKAFNKEYPTKYFEGNLEEYLEYSKMPVLPQANVIKSVCEHRNYRAGHSPFVPCICNDCGEEL